MQDGNATLQVDTTFLDALPFRTGALVQVALFFFFCFVVIVWGIACADCLVQFVGEMHQGPVGPMVLKARVCRAVDGLSMQVWAQSVALHRRMVTAINATIK